jgi:hypothetical protein
MNVGLQCLLEALASSLVQAGNVSLILAAAAFLTLVFTALAFATFAFFAFVFTALAFATFAFFTFVFAALAFATLAFFAFVFTALAFAALAFFAFFIASQHVATVKVGHGKWIFIGYHGAGECHGGNKGHTDGSGQWFEGRVLVRHVKPPLMVGMWAVLPWNAHSNPEGLFIIATFARGTRNPGIRCR